MKVWRSRSLRWSVLAVTALAMLVHARLVQAGIFDPIANNLHNAAGGWTTRITGLMSITFKTLAIIDLAWAAAIWAFEKDNLNSLALEVVKKLMFFSFIFYLLNNASFISDTITSSFQQLGSAAGGPQTVMTTDGIIDEGISIIARVMSANTGLVVSMSVEPEEILGNAIPPAYAGLVIGSSALTFTCITSLLIAVAYVVTAAQFFTLTIESYVMFAVGTVFLGMGSTSWTKDYVHRYLTYGINVGVRYLTLILVLSLTRGAIAEAAKSIIPFPVAVAILFDLSPIMHVLIAALLQGILAMKAPEMAHALLSGGSGLTAGSMKAAAANVASAAAKPVSMAASTMQGMSNFDKALNAGRTLAHQEGKTGRAATLSGLGKVAEEASKAIPGLVKGALKNMAHPGRMGGGGGGPGMFDRAQQALQARVEEVKTPSGGAAGGPTGGAAGGPTGSSPTQAAQSPGPALANTGAMDLAQPSPEQGPAASQRAAGPRGPAGASTPEGAPEELVARQAQPTTATTQTDSASASPTAAPSSADQETDSGSGRPLPRPESPAPSYHSTAEPTSRPMPSLRRASAPLPPSPETPPES
jgi:type IV secretion system protein TrbL